ncbi:Transport protein particle subunit trs31 [Yarrowia sp. B02]|nr:Transport protein particle subunit trs31 [Yarrowia sp. B02]
MSIPRGPSTPIIPSSKGAPQIPRTPSSTLPHPTAAQSPASASSSTFPSALNPNAPPTNPAPDYPPQMTAPTTSSSSIRKPGSIYERNINRRTPEVSLNAFAFLFSELVQYLLRQRKEAGANAGSLPDLETRLNTLGYHVGQRALELVTIREATAGASAKGGAGGRRENKILGILEFVHTHVWKMVFGRAADGLEKSRDEENEYMIIDNEPVVSKYVSVPRENSQLSVAAYAAGIIEAVLNGAKFPAKVSAHTVEDEEHPLRTVFLIKFDQAVIERDQKIAA